MLGYVAGDGRPLVAPVWFVVDDGQLVFNTGRDTSKGRALMRDSRVVIRESKSSDLMILNLTNHGPHLPFDRADRVPILNLPPLT